MPGFQELSSFQERREGDAASLSVCLRLPDSLKFHMLYKGPDISEQALRPPLRPRLPTSQPGPSPGMASWDSPALEAAAPTWLKDGLRWNISAKEGQGSSRNPLLQCTHLETKATGSRPGAQLQEPARKLAEGKAKKASEPRRGPCCAASRNYMHQYIHSTYIYMTIHSFTRDSV